MNKISRQVIAGNRSALARAITLVESTLTEHQLEAHSIIQDILPHSGQSLRIGITGVPGVGKSTFIEALGKYLTAQGIKVAVLAIDPSSEKSGGSILGDKPVCTNCRLMTWPLFAPHQQRVLWVE